MYSFPAVQFETAAPVQPIFTEERMPRRPLHHGLLDETMVETAEGWRPVASIGLGDLVQTFEGGLRPVTALRHQFISSATRAQMTLDPVVVRGGTLNTCRDLQLLPGQHVLIPTPDAQASLGYTHLLAEASALKGLGLARPASKRTALAITQLGFEEPEVVWANSGLLLSCPQAGRWSDLPSGYVRLDEAPVYAPTLTHVPTACPA